MSRLVASPAPESHAAAFNTPDTRLRGPWLLLARLLWLALFLLTLVVFYSNLVVGNYGLVTTIQVVVDSSVWFAVSLVLFWRKSSDRAILLISLLLVLTPGYLIPGYPGALVNDSVWWLPVTVLANLTGATLSVWYTFPDGRFVPSFTRWLVLGWLAVSWAPAPFLGGAHLWSWWLSPLYALVRIAFYVSLALALLYRYRWRATPLQRQQIKWVVFASTIFIGWVMVAELAVFVIPSYFPALGFITQLYRHVNVITFSLVSVLIPLSIGIALLRYRLWEIDAIINKALVYGLLTAWLATLYAGFIIGLESLAGAITGTANQPIALVISTLVIAALFLPVRRRLQALIDRRFYRRKYDAEKTLAAFSATLRNEVDLNKLREQLLAVVQETMQPTHVSLWLRSPERHIADWPHRLEPQGPAPTKPSDG